MNIKYRWLLPVCGSLLGIVHPAIAADQKPNAAQLEEIVVTGSHIVGTPENGALPVEVYSQEDLIKRGSPSQVDFLKSLSIQGDTAGQNTYLQGGGNTDRSLYNLRALGTARTVTLFNGLRGDTNIQQLPTMAIHRTEILKEGAAAIYGADATAGVVNNITYTNFEGFTTRAEYTHIPHAEGGNHFVGFRFGTGDSSANFFVSAEWDHRDDLLLSSRSWARKSYTVNPTMTVEYGNPGSFLLSTAVSGYAPPATGTGRALDFTEASCTAVGGLYYSSSFSAPNPVCGFDWPYFQHLTDRRDIISVYAQLSGVFGDANHYRVGLSYSDQTTPEQTQSPDYGMSIGPGGPTLRRGVTNQFVVPAENPFLPMFFQQAGLTPTTGTGLITEYWLPYGENGNLSSTRSSNGANTARIQRKSFMLNAQLDGDVTDRIKWETSMGLGLYRTESTSPAEIGYRLQMALNGFGGPNCNVADQTPYVAPTADTDAARRASYATLGTQNIVGAGGQQTGLKNGCYYYNPFSYGWSSNPNFNLANPRYVPTITIPGVVDPVSSSNPKELEDWISDPRHNIFQTISAELNLVLNGKLPLQLPGGDIGWAVGSQFRQRTESSNYPESNFASTFTNNPCAWPEQRVGDFGCPGMQGAYWLVAPATTFDNLQTVSKAIYGEADFPILDSLNVQAALRHENYDGASENPTVWKLAVRYQPLDFLTLRGSYGTNFAQPLLGAGTTPGSVLTYVESIAKAGGRYLGIDRVAAADLKGEEADVLSLGTLFNFDVGDTQHLAFSFDYFNIKIKNEAATITGNIIANQVITAGNGTFAQCNHPLANLITFINGPCIQDTTTGSEISRISAIYTNRPGITTSGIDFSAAYTMPAFTGDLTFKLGGTRTLKYEAGAFIHQGRQYAPPADGLGFLNASGTLTQQMPLWKGRAAATFDKGAHSVLFEVLYTGGVRDQRFDSTSTTPFTKQIVNGALVVGPIPDAGDVEAWMIANVSYTWHVTDNFTVNGLIHNLLDRDPPFAIYQTNYNALVADPYGRTLKLGVTWNTK